MRRFTPDRLRAEAERDAIKAKVAQVVTHDCEQWQNEGIGCAICNPTAIAWREAGKRDSVTKALQKAQTEVKRLTRERDEARAIAQRWHDDARDIASSSTQVEYKLRHKADAATVAGWSKEIDK